MIPEGAKDWIPNDWLVAVVTVVISFGGSILLTIRRKAGELRILEDSGKDTGFQLQDHNRRIQKLESDVKGHSDKLDEMRLEIRIGLTKIDAKLSPDADAMALKSARLLAEISERLGNLESPVLTPKPAPRRRKTPTANP